MTTLDKERPGYFECFAITSEGSILWCMNGADWRHKRTGHTYCRYHVWRELGRHWRHDVEPVPVRKG